MNLIARAKLQCGETGIKYVFIYGSLSGLVTIATVLAGLLLADLQGFFASIWFGYLVMLVALTFIFVGVKRYRDIDHGGVIKFGPAFITGLGIAAVAATVYVVVWEVYLAMTDYTFMDDYIAGLIRAREAEGLTGAALTREVAGFDQMREQYRNPLIRIPMTFLEIFPVGLIVALASAGLLRNPKLLPATR